MDAVLFENIKKDAEHGDKQAIKGLTYLAVNKCPNAENSLRKLADEGNPDAQREMGIYLDYLYTYSVINAKFNRDDDRIEPQAILNQVYYWWGKAAEQGDSFSLLRMKELGELKKEVGNKNT